jgi:hypothetical protein
MTLLKLLGLTMIRETKNVPLGGFRSQSRINSSGLWEAIKDLLYLPRIISSPVLIWICCGGLFGLVMVVSLYIN